MNELQVIKEQEVLGKEFRIYGDFENPLFLAKDVAEWIEYSQVRPGVYKVSQMVSTIEDDEKLITTLKLQGDTQSRPHTFLTEDGLYEVLMQSRKPIAKQFKKQVKTILKELRKGNLKLQSTKEEKAQLLLSIYNGGQEGIVASKRLTEIEVQEAKKPLLETIENKQTIIDNVIDDKSLFAIGTVGKILKPYISDMGAIKIFKFLRDNCILMDAEGTQRHNLPYDKYNKHFEMKCVESNFGTHTKTYFNGSGLKWFLNKLAKDGYLTSEQKEEIKSKF